MATLSQVSRQSPPDLNQLALDYAERQRNLLNSISGMHANQVYGGPSGAGALNDLSGVQLPSDMPSAYGLLGSTHGAQHDLFNDPQAAQAFLARARQYDPSAHIVYGQQNGGGGEGGGGIDEYYVDWDNSKLPQSVVPQNGHITNFGGYGQDRLTNPSMMANDPNFGVLTDNRNIKQPAPDLVDRISQFAPLIIGTIATMGAGAPLLAGASALGYGGQLATALPAFGRAVSGDDWLGALMSALPGLGGAAGVPSSLLSGASTLANIARGGKPNPIGLLGSAINAVGPGGRP